MTSLIKTLFTDQPSSVGINPQINTLRLLDFSRKQKPMLTIQSAISVGEPVKILFVPHNTAIFFTIGGIGRFMPRQSTFPAQSPIPKLNTLNGVKYICHLFTYLRRPAIMESTSNKVFVNCFSKRR